jgi:hypothetical protein
MKKEKEESDMKEMSELDKKLVQLNKTVEYHMFMARKDVKTVLDNVKSLTSKDNCELKADLKYKDKLLENYPTILKQLKIYKGLFWGVFGILAFYITVKFF